MSCGRVCGWSVEAVDIPSKSVILWPSNWIPVLQMPRYLLHLSIALILGALAFTAENGVTHIVIVTAAKSNLFLP